MLLKILRDGVFFGPGVKGKSASMCVILHALLYVCSLCNLVNPEDDLTRNEMYR